MKTATYENLSVVFSAVGFSVSFVLYSWFSIVGSEFTSFSVH